MEEKLGKKCKLNLTDGGLTMVHPGRSSHLSMYTSLLTAHSDDVPFAPTQCSEVFTHFRTSVEGLNDRMVRPPLALPSSYPSFPASASAFLPSHADPAYVNSIVDLSSPYDQRSTIPYEGGEASALARLEQYCAPRSSDKAGKAAPLMTYKQTRNALTGLDGSSHFSPFLSVGALSARTVYDRVKRAEEEHGGGNKDSYWLLFELLWRDYWKFCVRGPLGGNRVFKLYGLQAERSEGGRHANGGKGGSGGRGKKEGKRGGEPKLRQGKEHPPKDSKEWSHDKVKFEAWKEGKTGVPFVDANMRELAATGECFLISIAKPWCTNGSSWMRGRVHVEPRPAERRRLPRGPAER
jgi:deoxyribodipyrimidine photo-lyase